MNNPDSSAPILFLFLGISIGVFFTITLYEFLPTSSIVISENAIAICEQELPRNQKCIITAILEEK